ncbi:MAG: amidohydrolase [Hungatella sp.]|jgi:predicted amidohydrolase YtcJ|nr:amidohydrolase [Hungatella sp.]
MRTLYYNGSLYTGDPENPEAGAMVVENGEILWAGGKPGERLAWEEIFGEDVPEHKVDLKGRFVTSGFIDSHMHMVEYGKLLGEVSLADHTGSLKEVCDRVKEFIKENQIPKGTWVCGRGWNQDYFQDEKRFITCRDLDQVSAEHPIFLARACGHVVSVNSKAMELAGVTRETTQPSDGRFQVDHEGEPNGVFEENGISLVKDAIPPVTIQKVKEFILAAQRALNSFGITTVHTDDFLSLNGVDYEMVLRAYRELEEEGRLTIKICEQSQFENLEQLKEFAGKGYHTGAGTDYVRIGPLKIISDGSLGARTAFLSEPYADKRDTRGIAVLTQEELDQMISYAHGRGMQAAVHAIGDGSMEMVVRSFEKCLEEMPRQDHRHGIVHCQITTKPLLEKIKELSLHTYAQSIFLDYDSKIVESRVGRERAGDTYQFGTLFHMGQGLSNGSDCPVETPNVMKGIQCAVTRTSLDGARTFLPKEALTVEEALASYTVMGARASFEERKKGMLKKGMKADFVVLSENLLETPPDKLGQVLVEQTYVDGICVYERH